MRRTRECGTGFDNGGTCLDERPEPRSGLLTPLAGLIITGIMVMAIVVATGHKGFIVVGGLGYEYNLVLIAIALALVIAGPGRPSIDHQLGLDRAIG